MKFAKLDLKYFVHAVLEFIPSNGSATVFVHLLHDVVPHLLLGNIYFFLLCAFLILFTFAPLEPLFQLFLRNPSVPIFIEDIEGGLNVLLVKERDLVDCSGYKLVPRDDSVPILVHALHQSLVLVWRMLLTHHIRIAVHQDFQTLLEFLYRQMAIFVCV